MRANAEPLGDEDDQAGEKGQPHGEVDREDPERAESEQEHGQHSRLDDRALAPGDLLQLTPAQVLPPADALARASA